MPFTPTHMLAVLPLYRILPLSALAIGAMIPDVPLFFPGLSYEQTHSILGATTICLPLGFVAFLVFQWIMKIPLMALLPRWIQVRLSEHLRPNVKPTVRFFVCVGAAVVLGALSHVAWDSFTHAGRWGTQLVPALEQSVSIGPKKISGYKLFQYGSTFVGLPLIAIVAVGVLWKTEPREDVDLPEFDARQKSSAIVFCCAAAFAVAGYALMTEAGLALVVGKTIKTTGMAWMVSAFVYSLVFQLRTDGKHHL